MFGSQILRLSGFVNPYSQVKWIFSTKMALHKALVLFKLNSDAKMAPDNAGIKQFFAGGFEWETGIRSVHPAVSKWQRTDCALVPTA
jgi:hypothetical protein